MNPNPFISGRELSIVVSGVRRHYQKSITVADLTNELGFSEKRIAVERNGEVVPKSQYGVTSLANGDNIEIVVAVGGG